MARQKGNKDDQGITTGVVLLNMGGPECLEDVEPFLENLFSDRQIIRLGPASFLQRPLARWIARRRAPKSRAAYAAIGGASPQGAATSAVAGALARVLAAQGKFCVTVAMRYWRPRAAAALNILAAAHAEKIVALPLYPHFSRATSGSSLLDFRQAVQARLPEAELMEIRSWPAFPSYIDCLEKRIRDGLRYLPGAALVYSAHSLPARFVEEGDPYVGELRKTIAALEAKTGVNGSLCYQSRSGPVRWLAPSTPETIHALARQGMKDVLVVPLSFVSDHVETLYEIDQLYRPMARELGMRLERTAVFNDAPDFVGCLEKLLLDALGRG